MEYRTLNPATGELLESFPFVADEQVEGALARAARQFGDWRHRRLGDRLDLLQATAEALETRAGELARVMALEMGKPLAEGIAELRKCAWVCRYYLENGPAFLEPSPRPSDGAASWVAYEPLGPLLAIMPWNFPFWQVYRFAAPALLAGNVVLLKHAPGTPRCALAMAELMLAAGFPDGVFQNLFMSHQQAAAVMSDPRLRGVTFTGSSRGGRQVAAAAGSHLKTMVLELGGSDPFIVLEDADIREAAEVGAAARCLNTGQSCIAAKRFLVHAAAAEEFTAALAAAMSRRRVGDPMAEGTAMGPLARADLRDHLAAQVDDTVAAGARVVCGGSPLAGPGYFYPPTVLADAGTSAPAAHEELFGPVAPVFSFQTDQEALAMANASRYGLGASLWTADEKRARRLIPGIEAGAVFINGLVKSDPRLPFGGVKDSGFGRELSREGMYEFVNRKTVWMA